MSKEIKDTESDFRLSDLPQEEIDKVVGVFAWLIKEDKKQNPHLYQKNNIKKDNYSERE